MQRADEQGSRLVVSLAKGGSSSLARLPRQTSCGASTGAAHAYSSLSSCWRMSRELRGRGIVLGFLLFSPRAFICCDTCLLVGVTDESEDLYSAFYWDIDPETVASFLPFIGFQISELFHLDLHILIYSGILSSDILPSQYIVSSTIYISFTFVNYKAILRKLQV